MKNLYLLAFHTSAHTDTEKIAHTDTKKSTYLNVDFDVIRFLKFLDLERLPVS
eukprot:TRINITY_DN5216_c0_g1_i1.p1 TRINITY_DN5216_c0_g1~~TRINITY_DN5216_c0_g1_i1.p1  ORF type:complete len:53 (-),score=10.63 TRINITY_DN5216_c0_g1_i1:206-364(-)